MSPVTRRLLAAAAVAAVLSPGLADAGILGTYTFTGADPGGDLQTPNGNATAAPNSTYTSFARTGLNQVLTADNFASGAYSTAAAIDTAEYAEFTITADAGYRLQLQSVSFTHLRTGGNGPNSGPQSGAVRASFESYAAGSGTGSTFTPANNSANTATWDFTDYTSASAGSATFRFYGWNAGAGTGTLRHDDITLNGDIVSLAKMQASASTPATPVIVGAASSVDATVSNTAAGGTIQEGLAFTASGTGDISGSGGNTSLAPGAPQVVTLSIDTSTAGARGGNVNVVSTNAYSTNGNVGQTSFTQAVSVNVLDHSDGSFDSAVNDDEITVDFGTVTQGDTAQIARTLYNLVATTGFTAGFDLDSIVESDPSNVFSTDLATFTNLAAGSGQNFLLTLDTTTLGSFSGSLTLTGSDQNLPGATGGQSLTINLLGNVAVPEPASIGGLLVAGVFLLRRRRA